MPTIELPNLISELDLPELPIALSIFEILTFTISCGIADCDLLVIKFPDP